VRIKSKLKASVMAVAMVMIPVASHAAGMGRLNVLSGLGQPLRAEIDLVAVQPAEAESLRAALAPVEAYKEAQIDYPSGSLGLRFTLEKRAGGQYYISVISAQSISEPFLDFLVELKWDGGRVLREYTALLDPVGYAPSSAVGAKPAAVAQAGVGSPKSLAPAVTEQPEKTKKGKGKKGAAKEAVTEAKPAPAAKPAPSEQPESEDTYTVKSGDTLASIAHAHKLDGVSLEQMLVSLYEANQDAFDGKNMNRLKKGKILKLPGVEAADVEQKKAVQEIHAQAEDWRAYRSKLAESAGASQGAQGKEAGSGKISAKVEDKATPKQDASKDKLTLSKGDDSGKLKERVRNLEEDTSAKQKALDEASQRVADLEKTNKKLQDLLALKSKQGTDLQKQAEEAKAKPAETKPAKAEAKPAEPVKPAEVAKPVEAPKPVEAAKPVEPPKPVDAAKPADTKPADVKPAEAKPEEAKPAEPAAAAEAPKPKPKKKPVIVAPEPEESIFDNMAVVGGGLAALLAIGGGLFWFLRKRRKSSFEDSVITGSDLKSNTMVGNTGGAVISTGVTENSFLTDFSRAGLGTIDTDEVDPIAEAEVYMAYGRDAQAEEILKDALARDANRHEVRLKLLEIYNTRKNASAFESVARDLYTATQGQGPVWAQAAEMGRTLDPQNSLYQAQEPVNTGALDKTMILSAGTLGDLTDTAKLRQPLVTAPEAASVDAAGAATDLDFQLDTPAQEAGAAEGANALDFDLGFDAAPAPAPAAASPAELDMPEMPAAAEPVAAHEESSELDFDLGEFKLDTPAESATPIASPAPVADESEILSLDIPLDMGATEQAAPLVVESAPGSDMLDLSLDVGAHDAPAPAPAAELPLAELDTPDLAGGLDFSFDLSEPAAETPAPAPAPAHGEDAMADISLDLDVAPSSNVDDVMDFGVELDDPVTTKIDLARAYIDMGDKEGAREILQEAVTEGNAEQKASAESLLAQL